MNRLLPAYLLLALAVGACDSPTGGSGPQVDRVAVSPATRTISVGETAQLTASARDDQSELLTDVAFSWSSLEQNVATVTQTGLVTGVATGTARIVVSAAGKADTATITVVGAAAECGAGTDITLAVGQSVQRSGAAASVLCLPGGASGAEFTVIPFNGARVSGALTSVRATGAGLTAVTGPPNPSLAPFSVQGGLAARGAGRDDGFHARLNAASYARLRPLAPSARAGYRRRHGTGGARLSVNVTAPTVGSLLTLNTSTDSPCDIPDNRVGRVVAVGQRAVVVADTMNPANGLTTADYEMVAATFDSLVYPINVANFGAPADVDDNGRSIIFYTRAVNELTPANAGSVIGGFFYVRDLFPRAPSDDAPFYCETSNDAELFYLLAADPTGVVNGNVRSVEDVLESTIGTVGHEFQHLINASRRLYVQGTDNFDEEVYLNEGLSHIAEELLFYRHAQRAPRQNLGNSILAAGTATREAFILYGEDNELRYGEYLENTETNSPYEDGDDLAVRGAAWAFLRYAADQRAGDDAAFWFALVNNDATGLTNLQEVLGKDPIPVFRDFAVSVYTDDAVSGIPAIFTQPSWNHRSIWQNVSGGFPLRVRPLTSGVPLTVTLTAGGASYLRARVGAGGRGSIQLSTGDAPLSGNVTVTVVRTR